MMKWQLTELKEKYLSIILSILRHKDEKKILKCKPLHAANAIRINFN